MQQFCRDYPITEDGTLGGKITGYQLIFTCDKPHKDERYIKCLEASDTQSGESRTVEAFEKKYNVEVYWCEIDLSPAISNKWFGYIINPDKKYFKPLG